MAINVAVEIFVMDEKIIVVPTRRDDPGWGWIQIPAGITNTGYNVHAQIAVR